jgi:uncharacterized protein YoxC
MVAITFDIDTYSTDSSSLKRERRKTNNKLSGVVLFSLFATSRSCIIFIGFTVGRPGLFYIWTKIPNLNEQIKNLETQVNRLEGQVIWTKIPNLNKQIKNLETQVNRLEGQVNRLEEQNNCFAKLNNKLNATVQELNFVAKDLNETTIRLAGINDVFPGGRNKISSNIDDGQRTFVSVTTPSKVARDMDIYLQGVFITLFLVNSCQNMSTYAQCELVSFRSNHKPTQGASQIAWV